MNKPVKTLVALSGNPSSLMVAWLLKRQGQPIVPVHFDFSGNSQNFVHEFEKKLGVPVQVISCEQEVRAVLVDQVVSRIGAHQLYSAAAIFHQDFLFPKLLELRQKLGCQKIATGHWARVQTHEGSSARLLRALERDMDQSEWVMAVPSQDLDVLEMPLGSFSKLMADRLIAELELQSGGSEFSSASAVDQLVQSAITDIPQDVFGKWSYVNLQGQSVGQVTHFLSRYYGEEFCPEGQTESVSILDFVSGRQEILVGPLSQRWIKKIVLTHLVHANHSSPYVPMKATLSFGPFESPEINIQLFEGNTGVVQFKESISSAEFPLFPGQSVAFVDHEEIIGSALVRSVEWRETA